MHPVHTNKPCTLRSYATGHSYCTARLPHGPTQKGHFMIYAPVLRVRLEVFVLWGT